jgi:hypothetical protein
MFLTSEGALVAAILTALVCSGVGAWALLSFGMRRPRRDEAPHGNTRAASVRRVVVPAGTAPKV